MDAPMSFVRWIAALMLACVCCLGFTDVRAYAYAGETTRVSVSSASEQGNDRSDWPSISADGRYVAFQSSATNLVPDDTNGISDIFVHDRQTAQIERVSVSSSGEQGNSTSCCPSISPDGRYVAFQSCATNLVPDDTNWEWDVFVHDRQTAETTRVSVSSGGVGGDFHSDYPSISAGGRYVAFLSFATNLVPGDTNGCGDIFLHDRQTAQTERVSVSSGGEQGNSTSEYPSISADGRYVAFDSYASNLVPGDTNGYEDVFVHDHQTAQTTRVSLSSTGEQGNSDSWLPSISADGHYVAFTSGASNLVPNDTNWRFDVFVRDCQTDQTDRVSVSTGGEQGNDRSSWPSISADGRYVAFDSDASNLVPGDTNVDEDVLVHDRQTAETTRVSVSSAGEQGNDTSWYPSISADGRYVAFMSYASNLVPGDTNWTGDIFVHDRGPNCPCGDTDHSGGAVDLNDFATFALCFGLNEANPPDCDEEAFTCSDLDGDGDVDLPDFATFALWFGLVPDQYVPDCTPE